MDKIENRLPWADDLMERKEVANFLTHYLDSENSVNVLNVNSSWGAGKTFFLQRWRWAEINNRACVYFDAWKNDYSGDPFVSLVSAIKEQLTDQIPKEKGNKTLAEFSKRAAKAALAATPIIAKGLIQKITAVNVSDISDAATESAGNVAEKAIESLIDSHKETLESVEKFKGILSELLWKANEKNCRSKPAYIFVDELDRCRPTYAIELLERVKHLFDVAECKFIIASDTEQLCHSVSAVYGSGFNSAQYLKRFFDAEFSLPISDYTPWVKTKFQESPDISEAAVKLHLVKSVNRNRSVPFEKLVQPDELTVCANEENRLNPRQVIFLALTKTFSPKLREMEKLFQRITALEGNAGGDFHFFWAAYLIFLQDADKPLYRSALEGDVSVFEREVNTKFKPFKLYFGISNTDIHLVFLDYLRCFRGGRDEADRLISSGIGYSLTIGTEMYNSPEKLKKQVNLANLAHRIQ